MNSIQVSRPLWIAVVACSAGLAAFQSQALVFEYSSVTGSSIVFTGSGTLAEVSFNPSVGYNFQIDNVKDGTGSAVGYKGTFNGSWTMGPVSMVTVVPLVQTAPVSGVGTLTIRDSANFELTASVAWVTAVGLKTIGFPIIGFSGNITSVSYAGVDPDLLAYSHGSDLDSPLAFTLPNFGAFEPLGGLVTPGVHSTAFSGSLNAAVPESSHIAAVAGLGLLGFGVWRRNRG